MKSRKGSVMGTSIHKEISGESGTPMKFLGGMLANKLGDRVPGPMGDAMQGKGVAGAVLNPMAAIKNKFF
jgi:hypothetical protein|tara:strand:- start:218 stop:427 length:210 start_codon:yes stop_codon:yes gene_type:complete